MAYLLGYLYRKQITLNHPTGVITDYTVMLTVGQTSGLGAQIDCNGHMVSDVFNDIRFTTSDGITLLPYYVGRVEGSTGSKVANIWIKIDSIGTASTTIYMYYGNASAPSASDGNSVFVFFDDFSSGSIDTSKWDTAFVSPYSLTVSNNKLVMNPQSTTAGSGCGIIAKTPLTDGYYTIDSLVMKTNEYSGGEIGLVVGFSNKTSRDSTNYGNWYQVAASSLYSYTRTGHSQRLISWFGGTVAYNSTGSTTDYINKWAIISCRTIGYTNTYGSFYYNGNKYTANVNGYMSPHALYPFVHHGDWATNATSYCDWVGVRSCDLAEPAFLSYGSEETVPVVVSGYIREHGSLVNKVVCIFNRSTGALVGQMNSVGGHFSFNVQYGVEYYVIAFDDTFNAIIYDRIYGVST